MYIQRRYLQLPASKGLGEGLALDKVYPYSYALSKRQDIMKRTSITIVDVAEHLRPPEEMAAYLEANKRAEAGITIANLWISFRRSGGSNCSEHNN